MTTTTTTTKTITETVSAYALIKDIVIPILGIVITIVIGYIINNSLKNKEEKAKKKLLLIDSYMEYLKARTDDTIYYTLLAKYEILNSILINHNQYLQQRNLTVASESLHEIIAELFQELQKLGNRHSNWSDYTYKFSFLLGTIVYLKEVDHLEKILENNIKGVPKENFYNFILEIIKKDNEIIENLNSGDEYRVQVALTSIQNLII
ncbi:MAG: hypothetical protein ABWY22_13005 [Flavobacterium sp.]